MSSEATAFNSFTTEWKGRIDSLMKSIFVLSGGIMSITIGAYLNSPKPEIDPSYVIVIKSAWFCFATSIACSLLVPFILIISGAIVLKDWENKFKIGNDGKEVLDSPPWVHVTAWLLGSSALITCLVGLFMVAYGVSHIF